jgi:hypothetical protein
MELANHTRVQREVKLINYVLCAVDASRKTSEVHYLGLRNKTALEKPAPLSVPLKLSIWWWAAATFIQQR